MTQRRTPSGQGPSRRPGQAGRPGSRGAPRPTVGTRIEPRAGAARAGTGTGTGKATGNTSGKAAAKPARTTRPTAARRAGAAGATKRTVATRPKAFTGRATVLIVVLVALALAYTYPIREYLTQESTIAQMTADQAGQQREIDGLAETVEKWRDDEYVKIQARDRLFYVERGETPLLVLVDPQGAARDAGTAVPPAAPDRWYETLWGSVAAANAEPRN